MSSSSLVSTGVFGKNVDDEVSQIWKQVETRVVQMAGGDSSKIKPNLDINSVLQHLDQSQAKDKKASEKYGTVKNIFNRTLQCIQTVGGIVADGASYVFAPAGTCYNALTFVIQAWQGYEGIFESLAGLLEKCIEFLERLTYYTDYGMDSKLTKIACQHLQIFVDICDHTLKLRSKRSKFAAFMKQMFLNDDGVQELLGAMKNLVEKEHGLVSAQTWKSSNEAAANSKDGLNLTRNMHTSLVDDRKQKQHEKDINNWKLVILNALDLDRTIIEPGREPWDKMWKRHKGNILEGTGEWLFQDTRFTRWVSGSQDSKRILALEGEEGAGKTLLASNIVVHLRKMKGSGKRVVTAHNFLDIDTKSTTDANDANIISRYVMCQLALAEDPVMKSVAAICEKSQSFSSALDMWAQLLLENQDLLAMDVTFYIVLDGLGANAEVLISFLQRFSDNPIIQRTRILLTGNKALFDAINSAGGVKMDKIVLGDANATDLVLYINKRMDGMEILKSTSRPGVSELRTKILSSLQYSTRGDYYKVERVLDNISRTDDVEEIDALLESAGDVRPDQIESDIEKLNQQRTPKEIAEINEMILWVNDARIWLSPAQIEAVLALKAGPKASSSLMSIEAKIASKYTIFTTDTGFVEYKVGEIQRRIPLKKRDVVDGESSSGFKEIQPAEVNIIKHYLSTICPSDLYQKFGFDDFFDLKMARKGNYICQDPDNAQVNMVLRCLSCITDQRNEKTERILDYARDNLHIHLKETDLSLTDRTLKAQVGDTLLRLFTEPYALDSLFGFHLLHEDADEVPFSKDDLPTSWKTWILSDQGVNSLAKWLKDSAVIENIKSTSLVAAFNAPDANRHLALFGSSARTAAEDLFTKDTTQRETIRAYILLDTILNKDKPPTEESKETNDGDQSTAAAPVDGKEKKTEDGEDVDSVHSPASADIQWLEDWAQKTLKIEEKSSTWEAQASLLLSYVAGEKIPKSLAEERARKALDMDPESWVASYALSQVVESEGESLSHLEKVLDKLLKDKEWQNERGHEGILARVIYSLGDKYWEDGELQEEAIATYSKVFDLDKSIYLFIGYSDVLQKYSMAGCWEPMIKFFERLLDEPQDGPNATGEFLMDRLLEPGEEFLSLLVKLFERSARYDLLETLFVRAIAKATSKGDQDDLFTIRYYYGKTLFSIKGHEEAGIAVWELYKNEATTELHERAVNLIDTYMVPAWLELATAKDVDPVRAQGFFDKIETAYLEFEALEWHDIEPTVAFAQYFRCRGDTDKAKQILRPRVTEALEMLSDDRTDNDLYSLYSLGHILAVMRDLPNHIACMDLMRLALRIAREEYAKAVAKYEAEDIQMEIAMAKGETFIRSSLSLPDEPQTAFFLCDGCRAEICFASEIWTCLSESGSLQLDDKCYKKLMEGRLGPVCSKDHEHYWVPKRNVEEIDAVPVGSVKLGDEVISFEAWKDKIREQYIGMEN
ncbi:neutral amino acid permease [Fusarium mexicanum]|uniref:Neutral amino acid permease n=1 Tax=Fusarium mexicanum TaxID=751941 RepID=A0A8H5J6Q6_9HYPO|nr:neutral amino acid permease [Fusarium mexicanum]